MKQHQETISVRTPGRGLHEVSQLVHAALKRSAFSTGLCTVFCQHTSCSLVIQENADPSARKDLETWLEGIAPEGEGLYTHSDEGPDDMPSHLRAAVTKTSEVIPFREGRLALGTWQGIFLAEHRARPHQRSLVIHLLGE